MASSAARAQLQSSNTTTGSLHFGNGQQTSNNSYTATCAGTKRNGDACRNTVRGKAGSDMIAAGRLPMCHIHRNQHITCMPGRCQATDTNGDRCSFVFPARPGYNQLCHHHRDTILRCHITRLPIELRMMIFEQIIPEGPIRTRNLEEDYHDALALRLVNHQVSKEVGSMLYASQSRPLEIRIDERSIEFLSSRFGHAPLGFRYVDVTQINNSLLGLFAHVKLNFVGSCALEVNRFNDDDNVLRILELGRRALRVLKRNEDRKIPLATIEVDSKFCSYAQNLESNDIHRMLAFSKLVVHLTKMMISSHVTMQFRLHATYAVEHQNWRISEPPELIFKSLIVSGASLRIELSEGLSQEDKITLAADLPSIENMLRIKPSNDQVHGHRKCWREYEKLFALARTFNDIVCQSELEYSRYRFTTGAFAPCVGYRSVMTMARCALENRDQQALTQLRTLLKAAINDFLHPLLSIVNDEDHEDPSLDELEDLPVIVPPDHRTPEWPSILEQVDTDGCDAVVEDDVYEKYVINGQTVYRLITPSVAVERLWANPA